MNSLSDECREPRAQSAGAQYVGVLNGVWYRMDAGKHASAGAFRLAPDDVPPPAVAARLIAGLNTHSFPAPAKPEPVVVALSGSLAVADGVPAEEMIAGQGTETQAKVVKPFHRESAEPLRAGHPDLWNLLVAGTSLEGSTFCWG
jgi:hypothetical protein